MVGSNIANVGLILGVAAVSRPLVIQMRLLRVELPLVIGISAGLSWMASDGEVGRSDGQIMLLAFAGFLLLMYRSAKSEGHRDALVGLLTAENVSEFLLIVSALGECRAKNATVA